MFDQRDDHQKRIQALVSELLSTGTGATLTWDKIEGIVTSGRNEKDGRYRIMQARKRLLRDHSIATIAIPGVGVKLLTPKDQVMVCATNRQKRMFRQAYRGMAEVGCADKSKLSPHHQMAQAATLTSLREQRKQLRKNVAILIGKPRGGNGTHRKADK